MSRQRIPQVVYSILFGLGLLCFYGWTYKTPAPRGIGHIQIDERLAEVRKSFRG